MHSDVTPSTQPQVRYAVVGLGHIAQTAVLPAFRHASNSKIMALVSNDPVKLKKLSRKYKVPYKFSYDEYEQCLRSGEIDAVYIALPNHLHCEYTVRAAEAGCHVLCEKPMAVTEDECRLMITSTAERDVRLMIAYRLHFEEANLAAIELVQSGRLGEPRYFESTFSMQAREDGIRLRNATGGGTLYDIGIYCINAARYLFRDEPTEALCISARDTAPRFNEVDEMSSAVLRFPRDRLASFTCSFGAADVSAYRLVGTEGDVRLEPAYDYSQKLAIYTTVGGKTAKKTFPKRDQFAAELMHFSECVLERKTPQPSGEEGRADVHIIQALYRSAAERRPVMLDPVVPHQRPSIEDEIHRPASRPPELVHAESPSL